MCIDQIKSNRMSSSSNRDRIWSFERREYWDSRYKQRLDENIEAFQETRFDWLCTYGALRGCIGRYLQGASLALDLGCGNADFAAAVCVDYPRLTVLGIDYSSTLFDICGTTLGPNERTEWLVMDGRCLAFRSETFDVVLDKGCLDALCAGCDQIAVLRNWGRNITEEEEGMAAAASRSVQRLLLGVQRCLVPGGRYICISYEGPSGRQPIFDGAVASGLSLTLVETAVEEENHNYIYIFEKRPAVAAGAQSV